MDNGNNRRRFAPLNKVKLTTPDEHFDLRQLGAVQPKHLEFDVDALEMSTAIGKGSHGKVYKAYDKMHKRIVALKMVEAMSKDDVAILQLESENMVKCDHPNIVRCYGIQFKDTTMYIAMEYMDIGPLSRIIQYKKSLHENILGYIAYQVLKGLVYLHKFQHIVHRDLKPSNLLINSEGEIKIADFGVSGKVKATEDNKRTWIGTALYMSPERIEGKDYTTNSDVWSLGLIIWECAIGYFPYFENNQKPTNLNILSLRNLIVEYDTPKFPNEFSPNFRDFLTLCLKKDKNQRAKSFELLEHPFVRKFKNEGTEKFKKWVEFAVQEIIMMSEHKR